MKTNTNEKITQILMSARNTALEQAHSYTELAKSIDSQIAKLSGDRTPIEAPITHKRRGPYKKRSQNFEKELVALKMAGKPLNINEIHPMVGGNIASLYKILDTMARKGLIVKSKSRRQTSRGLRNIYEYSVPQPKTGIEEQRDIWGKVISTL